MQPDGAWHQQVAKLEDIWPEIQKLYRSKIVTAVSPGPRYLLPLDLHRRIGVSAP